MKALVKSLEFMTNFYWPLFPTTILQSFWQSIKRPDSRTPAGMLKGVLLLNTETFSVSLYSGWTGLEIRHLLWEHQIAFWGWGFYGGKLHFHVHEDDAFEAQQIMEAAGVPLA